MTHRGESSTNISLSALERNSTNFYISKWILQHFLTIRNQQSHSNRKMTRKLQWQYILIIETWIIGLSAGYKVSPTVLGGTCHIRPISFLIVNRCSTEVEEAAKISTTWNHQTMDKKLWQQRVIIYLKQRTTKDKNLQIKI